MCLGRNCRFCIYPVPLNVNDRWQYTNTEIKRFLPPFMVISEVPDFSHITKAHAKCKAGLCEDLIKAPNPYQLALRTSTSLC